MNQNVINFFLRQKFIRFLKYIYNIYIYVYKGFSTMLEKENQKRKRSDGDIGKTIDSLYGLSALLLNRTHSRGIVNISAVFPRYQSLFSKSWYKLTPTADLWAQSLSTLVIQSLSCVQLFVTPRTARRPGFPVLHHLPELAQTHVHWVGDGTVISSILWKKKLTNTDRKHW